VAYASDREIQKPATGGGDALVRFPRRGIARRLIDQRG
jgi:hypothetical protein